MQIPRSIHSKQYPSFIRKHRVFEDLEIKKVFPKIGLENSTQKFKLTKVNDIDGVIARHLNRIRNLLFISYDDSLRLPIALRDLMNAIRFVIFKEKYSIRKKAGKIFVELSTSITTHGKKFKAGTNIFDMINEVIRCHQRHNYYANHLILSLRELLRPGSNGFVGLQQPNLSISFSSTGNKGTWDMATMSMRGITSCQRWSSTNHRQHLIGSIVDPCAGILYISNNKDTRYGSNMVRRSIVRFVFNVQTRKPALLLERIYPHNFNSEASDLITLAAFKDYLKTKTDNRFPIVYGQIQSVQHLNIPLMSNTISNSIDSHQRSYRDSGITYGPYRGINKLLAA